MSVRLRIIWHDTFEVGMNGPVHPLFRIFATHFLVIVRREQVRRLLEGFDLGSVQSTFLFGRRFYRW